MNYRKVLEGESYRLCQENKIGDNLFFTYTNGINQVHCNYFAADREFRLIYGEKRYQPICKPVTGYAEKVTPSVSIIGMTDSVECMVVQTADGGFVIIDGGYGTNSNYTKTLNSGKTSERTVTISRDAAADMESLYALLSEKVPKGETPQITWMITHADPDHIGLPTRFLKEYSDKINVNTFIYNFPNTEVLGLGQLSNPDSYTGEKPAAYTGYINKFLQAAEDYFPAANHYVYHTGDRFYLPGCEIEFLFTFEDLAPDVMPWMNHTSGTWRFTMEGKTVLIPGDAEKACCNHMVANFGSYLQSDVLQLNHHGANGATLGFYEAVDPSVCFWCCQQYHFDYDRRHLGTQKGYDFNKFIRNSEKVIANYCNSETATIYLSSLMPEV